MRAAIAPCARSATSASAKARASAWAAHRKEVQSAAVTTMAHVRADSAEILWAQWSKEYTHAALPREGSACPARHAAVQCVQRSSRSLEAPRLPPQARRIAASASQGARTWQLCPRCSCESKKNAIAFIRLGRLAIIACGTRCTHTD